MSDAISGVIGDVITGLLHLVEVLYVVDVAHRGAVRDELVILAPVLELELALQPRGGPADQLVKDVEVALRAGPVARGCWGRVTVRRGSPSARRGRFT